MQSETIDKKKSTVLWETLVDTCVSIKDRRACPNQGLLQGGSLFYLQSSYTTWKVFWELHPDDVPILASL